MDCLMFKLSTYGSELYVPTRLDHTMSMIVQHFYRRFYEGVYGRFMMSFLNW